MVVGVHEPKALSRLSLLLRLSFASLPGPVDHCTMNFIFTPIVRTNCRRAGVRGMSQIPDVVDGTPSARAQNARSERSPSQHHAEPRTARRGALKQPSQPLADLCA